MSSRHLCCQCGVDMQPFFARRDAAGHPVELSWCPRCGGLWLAYGQLEKVLGRPLQPDVIADGHTERRCAFCRLTLVPAILPGGVAAETCSACRGMFLDRGELEELGGAEPGFVPETDPSQAAAQLAPGFWGPLPSAQGGSGAAPLPAEVGALRLDEPQFELAALREEDRQARANPAPRAGDSVEFLCVKCGGRFALREGNAIAQGIACRACTPQVRGLPRLLDGPVRAPGPRRGLLTVFQGIVDWLSWL